MIYNRCFTIKLNSCGNNTNILRRNGDAITMEFTYDEAKKAEKQILENQKKIDYDIRDFTIDYLVSQFRTERFYIPEYQRRFVWNNNTQSRFIESILLGIPIPLLFLAVDDETGDFEIVDGAQRIQTLDAFINDRLVLSNLSELTMINGYKFSDLTSAIRRKFENKALRMIVLEDSTTVESRKEIFNRINTAGVKATPIEVRMGTYDGPFIEFIKRLALDDKYQKLAPMTSKNINRKVQYELLFRFFAYSEKLDKYDNNVQNFIDNYTMENQNNFDKERLESEFYNVLDFVEKYFPHGFKKTAGAKSTPNARFEAIAIGTNLALRANPNLKNPDMSWLDSDEFKRITTSDGANNRTKLIGRIYYVRDMLLGKK